MRRGLFLHPHPPPLSFRHTRITQEDLTNAIANPDLANAFVDFLSALSGRIATEHANQYKTGQDHKVAPAVELRAMWRLKDQILLWLAGPALPPPRFGVAPGLPGFLLR